MKTLRSCTRLQKVQAKTAAEEAKAKEKARSSVMNDPYNGFLLTNPRFALMLDDIEMTLAAVQQTQLAVVRAIAFDAPMQAQTKLDFKIAFLSNGNVALRVRQAAAQTDRVVETALKELRFPLARACNIHTPPLGTVQLCRFDESLNVLRRELDTSSEGGWSQVAAKAAASRRTPAAQPREEERGFLVLGRLGSRSVGAEEREKVELKRKDASGKKKVELKKEESVVEDWEDAMEKEEESAKDAQAGAGDVPQEGEVEVVADGDHAAQAVSPAVTTFEDAVEVLAEGQVESAPDVEVLASTSNVPVNDDVD